MSHYKEQHILPKFYLKRFCQEEFYSGQKTFNTFYYDRDKQILGKKSPENLLCRPHYYSFKDENGIYHPNLEIAFGALESPASLVFNKIQANVDMTIRKSGSPDLLSSKERLVLVQFMIMLIRRTPAILETFKKMLIQYMREKEKEIPDGYLNHLILPLAMKLGDEQNIEELLSNKKFYFLGSPKAPIITTDSPLTIMNGKGLKNGEEIYFPISKNCLLMLHDEGDSETYGTLDDQVLARKVNRHMAQFATTHIICSSMPYLQRIIKNLKFTPKFS